MSAVIQIDPQRPGAYATLKDAVTDAVDSATLVLAPGVYHESIDVTGLNLTITAADREAETVIDGNDSYDPTLGCRRGSLKIDGISVRSHGSDALRVADCQLTIIGGTFSSQYGVALRLTDRSKVEITGSSVSDSQQGIVAEDIGGTIDRVTITGSTDDAIAIRFGSDVTIRNTIINGSGYRGIYIYENARPVIENCDISNTREQGILVAQGAHTQLSRCKIHNVTGHPIEFASATSGSVHGCTLSARMEPAIKIAADAQVEVVEGVPGAAGVNDDLGLGQADPHRVEELLADLDKMVGLDGVKAEVRSIIDEIQVNEWRRSAGLAVDGMSNHLIFAGAPGTGKTTVARIYGQLLAALGVLPGGPLKEVSRRDLVAGYVGHTAEKTAAIFEEARGGVVFLDEAYTLTRSAGGNDFGQEAVDMIVKLMEDMRQEIAVIAAGYTQEMVDFLDTNPGLASRFVKTIEFPNYSAEDLTLIITRMMGSGDYRVGDGVEQIVQSYFEDVPKDANFGNARDARKLFEAMRKAQSQRLRAMQAKPTLDQLVELTADDARAVAMINPVQQIPDPVSVPAPETYEEPPAAPQSFGTPLDSSTSRWLG